MNMFSDNDIRVGRIGAFCVMLGLLSFIGRLWPGFPLRDMIFQCGWACALPVGTWLGYRATRHAQRASTQIPPAAEFAWKVGLVLVSIHLLAFMFDLMSALNHGEIAR